jgi:uracil phosphoribosyltransferase
VLATGNTATAAIDRVKERGAKDIRFVCLIAAQQGVERVRGLHPDVRLWTAAIDRGGSDAIRSTTSARLDHAARR